MSLFASGHPAFTPMMMLWAHLAQAGGDGTSGSQATEVEPPVDASHPFLKEGLDAVGIGSLMDEIDLRAHGWLEQSFTFNPADPDDDLNALRAFDDRANDYLFNQL